MTLQFPPSPVTGQVFPSPLIPGAPSWFFDGTKWVSGGFSGAVVSTSPLPPLNPRVGDLWFDPQEGNTYVWFDDGTSKQWVISINASGLAFPDAFDQPTLNQPRIMGVTDGSDAAPGQVGEYVTATATGNIAVNTATNISDTTITLSAGCWHVAGFCGFTSTTAGYVWIYDITAAALVGITGQIIGGLTATGLTLQTGIARSNSASAKQFCIRAQSATATAVTAFIQAIRTR